MADNVAVTAGTGTSIAADEVVDGTLGTVKVQYVKLMDGTLDGSTKAAVGANGLKVDPTSAVAMNTGVRSSTTQRVTIATDDVVPVSGSLTTVSTVTNLSQLGGTAIAMGTGVRSAGTQRVTVATDDLVPVTGTITAVTSLTQMNGAAIAMGTGVRSAGTQRVTIATDDVVPASQSGTWTVQPGNTANTTPWLAKISDGTNAAAIKAASTAPVASDPALVVAISPNSVNANTSDGSGQTSTTHVGAPTIPYDAYSQYETVAASQTDQVMGATGAQYDYLAGVLIIPGTSAAGAVSVKDGNGSAISVFAGGGTTALADLKPFLVPLGLHALAGTSAGWKITTGANVTAIGIGKFT